MNRHVIVILASLAWLLGCTIAGHYSRDRTDAGDFPTRWSWFFKWAGIIGLVIIMGIDLLLVGLSGKR